MTDIAAILLVAGAGGSDVSPLNAFDAALHDGGGAALSNINLVQVSSIVPPGVQAYRLRDGAVVDAQGMLAHAVVSAAPAYADDVVSAAAGIAVPDDAKNSGMIFETHGPFEEGEAQLRLEAMLDEGMRLRNANPGMWKTHTAVATSRPVLNMPQRFRCAIACTVLLDPLGFAKYAPSLEPA